MSPPDFERAWLESDAIAARDGHDPHRFWDGLPFKGKRVIIRCLHGYGDAIQFLRYARLLHRDAARIIVETHPNWFPWSKPFRLSMKKLRGAIRLVRRLRNGTSRLKSWNCRGPSARGSTPILALGRQQLESGALHQPAGMGAHS